MFTIKKTYICIFTFKDLFFIYETKYLNLVLKDKDLIYMKTF